MVSIEKQWRFNLLILFLGFLPAWCWMDCCNGTSV
jgi:hypothetical protein